MNVDLSNIIKIYENYVEDGDIDRANFFLATAVGFLSFLAVNGFIDVNKLSKFASKLRLEIVEGPNYLNPYVMELLGIVEEGLSSDNFNELISKLRTLLKEERLDRLEV